MPRHAESANELGGDSLDDLFNYNVDTEDVLKTLEVNATKSSESNKPKTTPGADLGIDEEIQISKQRRPNPKLDHERLLSQNGIPKLRRISKERLKFKGKGHEFSDVGRLLNLYQLWLDDLYPRAKFADGLAMIEKLGHTKRLQIMRKVWINESKPQYTEDDIGVPFEAVGPITIDSALSQSHDQDQHASPQQQPRAQSAGRVHHSQELQSGNDRTEPNEAPSEDELDALLAEDEALATDRPSASLTNRSSLDQRASSNKMDAFADEMEAMADFDDMG